MSRDMISTNLTFQFVPPSGTPGAEAAQGWALRSRWAAVRPARRHGGMRIGELGILLHVNIYMRLGFMQRICYSVRIVSVMMGLELCLGL